MLGGYIWFGQAAKVRKNRAELAGNSEKTGEIELDIFDLPKQQSIYTCNRTDRRGLTYEGEQEP